jgi:hypothetical protein
MWPFIVTDYPRYGREDQARYKGSDWTGYVYIDPRCPRLRFGKPTQTFASEIVKEFVQIALGKRHDQNYSTGRLPLLMTEHSR